MFLHLKAIVLAIRYVTCSNLYTSIISFMYNLKIRPIDLHLRGLSFLSNGMWAIVPEQFEEWLSIIFVIIAKSQLLQHSSIHS